MNTIQIKKTHLAILSLLLVMGAAIVAQAAAPNLMAAFFVKGKVGLKWSKVDGAAEYLVFRKDDSGDYAQIGSTDQDRYFDTEVTGGASYTYKIAVSEGGALVYSGTKSVKIPGTVGGFKAPSWVGLRYDRQKVFANWDDVPNAIAYNVWRSTTSGSGFEVVGTAEASRYVDAGSGLVAGTTYYYVLSAMNSEFEETPQSSELSIKFGVSAAEREAASEKVVVVLDPVTLTNLFEIKESPAGEPLNQPSDLALNSQGNIYLTDTLNGQVHCYGPKGKPKFSIGDKMDQRTQPADYIEGGFLMPFTVAIDSQDQVYVGDVQRNDIQVFAADGTYVRRIQIPAGEGESALRPNGLAVLSDGRLVITDAGNHRVLVTDGNGVIKQVVGGRSLEGAGFNFPDQLTVSADGTICVVDALNTRIVEFDLEGKFLRAFGSAGHSAGTFGRPKGIAMDPAGRIWVSDGMSHLIQSFTVEGEVKSVLGAADDEYSFEAPRGMWFTGDKMYVVERLAQKVSVFQIKSQ